MKQLNIRDKQGNLVSAKWDNELAEDLKMCGIDVELELKIMLKRMASE